MSTQRVIPQTWRGILGRCLLVAFVALMLLGVGGPRAAHAAGAYVVDECVYSPGEGNHNPTAPDAVYASNTTGYQGFGPPCGPGGSFPLGAGYGTIPISCGCYAYAQWVLTAPPGTYIQDLVASARFESVNGHTAEARLSSDGSPNLAVWNSVNYPNPYAWNEIKPGQKTAAKYLSVTVACGGNCSGGVGYVGLQQISMTMADTVAPTITAIGGDLASAGVHRGTETLAVNGNDVGSGVRRAAVKVNDIAIATQTRACDTTVAGTAKRFKPCPASAAYEFSLSTEADPWVEGNNKLEVCVADFSTGSFSPNETCQTRAVSVDNSCDDSTGAPAASSLSAGLEPKPGQLLSRASVKSTEGLPLKGKLAGPGGPVANASICVYEQVDVPGDPRNLVQVAKTGSQGDYKINLSPGPSRNLEAVYRYKSKTIEQPLYLESQAVPALKIRKRHLHNGQNMRFKGSIPVPHAEQRAVTMQAKVGKTWRTFKQLKTNEDGRFKGRYKFKHSTLARAKYTFRVLVKAQNGYPFAPGKSNKQKVIVRG